MQKTPSPNQLDRRHLDGVVLIAMLTILVILFTSITISMVSVDKLRARRLQENSQILNLAAEALFGYAVQQTPPGTLPCPDTDGDGLENIVIGGCQSQRGLLPYRTLNISETRDKSGWRLWYAVELNYSRNAIVNRNASTATTLNLDGQLGAALVIAANGAINGQGRTLLNAADFLEGENANASLDTYASLQDENKNDQVLLLKRQAFWSLMEVPVLSRTISLIENYRSMCLEYPFAAVFGGPYTSVNNLQSGHIPFASALPTDWGGVCPLGVAPTPPSWLISNWQGELFYQMCLSGEGSCITTVGNVNPAVSAIILAPGTQLQTQLRPSTLSANYFELENVSLPTTEFRDLKTINHSTNYNDVSKTISP